MKLQLAFLALCIASTMSKLALADSACGEWSPCPELAEGDCAGADAGAPCGDGGETCRPTRQGCGLFVKDDGGRALYYCTKPPGPPPPCGDDGGCTVASDSARAARAFGFPSALVAAGTVLLAIDRRRRRRGRY